MEHHRYEHNIKAHYHIEEMETAVKRINICNIYTNMWNDPVPNNVHFQHLEHLPKLQQKQHDIKLLNFYQTRLMNKNINNRWRCNFLSKRP